MRLVNCLVLSFASSVMLAGCADLGFYDYKNASASESVNPNPGAFLPAKVYFDAYNSNHKNSNSKFPYQHHF